MTSIQKYQDQLAEYENRDQPLTPQEQVFCHALVGNRWDSRKAALEAGYSAEYGYKMEKKPHIKAYIMNLIEDVKDNLHITLQETMDVLACVATFDPIDKWKMDEDGNLVIRHETEMPKELRMAIKKSKHRVTVAEDGTRVEETEFEWYDRNAAMRIAADCMNAREVLRRRMGVEATGPTDPSKVYGVVVQLPQGGLNAQPEPNSHSDIRTVHPVNEGGLYAHEEPGGPNHPGEPGL